MRRGEVWKPLRENGGWMRTPERAVFLALLERSNNDDCSIPPKMTPGLAGLAEMACCSKSTVALALKHLEWHNWLTRKQSKGGAGCKTTYQLRAGLRCYPDCEQRHPRTVRQPDSFQSGESGSRTVKLSDSHPQSRRSTPVFGGGQTEGGGKREGKGLSLVPANGVSPLGTALGLGDTLPDPYAPRPACIAPGCGELARRGCATCWEHARTQEPAAGPP